MSVVSSFGELLASFFPLMTAPSSQNFVTVASGWILTPGRRTITQLIQCVGAVGKKDHSTFHRFLSAAPWSLDAVSQTLLDCSPRDGTVQSGDHVVRKRRTSAEPFSQASLVHNEVHTVVCRSADDDPTRVSSRTFFAGSSAEPGQPKNPEAV